jgi:DNA-binding response OmpR family regulator
MMSVTVAIVEDDFDILCLMREILEIDGFQVATFSNPDTQKIEKMDPAPALFLLDLMLPGMTGVELAGCLRRSAYPDTPMIAMSASRMMLEMASASGLFQDTIAKPFNLSTLLSRIEELVRNGNGAEVR